MNTFDFARSFCGLETWNSKEVLVETNLGYLEEPSSIIFLDI